ncbi:uncharacterized protein LOC130048676 [Ostrea edulis]|uniref:uncharacterized protein LOC130048676 n=1 Tax=Ostrea edulis TaxID=37623 RepID=UPI0024AF3770|nr:uncharacterized protein LOC130048676 [Ostrea edulis]
MSSSPSRKWVTLITKPGRPDSSRWKSDQGCDRPATYTAEFIYLATETAIVNNSIPGQADIESREDSVNLTGKPKWKSQLLSCKGKLRVTLLQTGKLKELYDNAERYHLDIVGVQEVRWSGKDKNRHDSWTFIYSGRDDQKHEAGVGVLLSKRAADAVNSTDCISERLLKIRFKAGVTNLTVIVGYAPTEVANTPEKHEFYEQLNNILGNIPRHDMCLLIGDFNARVGIRHKRKEWISVQTEELVEKRRTANGRKDSTGTRRRSEEYRKLDALVKKSPKKEKENWFDKCASELEVASGMKNQRKVFQIVKKVNRRSAPQPMSVKSKEGNILTDKDQVKDRWRKHFCELLNRPAPARRYHPSQQLWEELDIDTSEPSEEDVEKAINKLKNNKSAGTDSVTAELIQYGG